MANRRDVLRMMASAAAATQFPLAALAQDYPTKSVRVAVTTAPGGTSDILSRLTAKFMSERLGQPFVIENLPGAGGNIATQSVHRAPADGYTLLSIAKVNVLSNLLYEKLSFDFMRDFVPVGGIASGALVMLVHPSVPAKSLAEFIAYAKTNPTKLNYSTPGMGTDPHLSAEMLKMLAGIEMAHVPYRGGALALTDLLAGNVQVMFSNLPVGEFIRTGKLIALGTTGVARNPEFPDLPPIAETVPNYQVGVWYGYVARRGTPADIIEKLNGALGAALADSAVLKGISAINAEPLRMTAAQFEKHLQAEQERWGNVIKAANIKLN